MTSILFMDDDMIRCELFMAKHPDAQIVHTAQECIQQLQKQTWDFVYLDHDLGEGANNTGSFVAEWIAMNKPSIKGIIIHSWNVPAGDRMEACLSVAGYCCRRCAFGPSLLNAVTV